MTVDRSLTIFICTRDRPDELSSALASIARGSMAPARVLVSDDSEDGQATEEIARKFGVDYQRGPRRGLGANRNACVEDLNTDLCAFIDDDVIVSSDFVKHASTAPQTQITTGWELNFSTEPARRVFASNASFLGFQKSDTRHGLKSIVINATAIPRKAFSTIRFDELTRYGYEEIDFARHASAAGWTIAHNPDLWVEHHPSAYGRADYNAQLDVSRIYLTRFAYARYDRNPIKSWTYSVVSAVHLLLSAAKSRRPIGETLNVIRRSNAIYRTRIRAEEAS
ncbi:hypothetical protein DEA06_15885 [Microbacterium sp. Gd 4-13]|uniref:glycosyltransferase family 2 protein n=1 Tax=Microbacterium sp. Gd 4-13 TaxID=2173179 RepID=UPI000D56D699|nr:glycosyltransferase family 2 protein [Microbacterium sp. Gd 4-13]PVW02155.1 hypothetical protein DEA06_15885 [Microbacterium sp. Gd 4-13]